MGIVVRNLAKTYKTDKEQVAALRGVDLEVSDGQFFVLLGPSGSGKTTLLRCVAGLENPDHGEIYLDSVCVYSGAEFTSVTPEQRKLGMVFQSYAIWPHMTVFDNVAVPLVHGTRKIPKSAVKERVYEALALVGMEELAGRPAPQLSGGQQQRVALARALALKPAILLMDEPLSNLDARLREEVRNELKTLIKTTGVTALYVTHDQNEAMELADCIAVMHQGNVLAVGPPEELYRSPGHQDVAHFLGSMNWLAGNVRHDLTIETPLGILRSTKVGAANHDASVMVGIRPEDVRLTDGAMEIVTDAGATTNTFRGEVVSEDFLGDYRVYRIAVNDQVLVAKTPAFQKVTGQVHVHIPEDGVLIFGQSGITSQGVETSAAAS